MKSTSDRWNANLYDKKHDFVSQYGEGVMQLLAPKQGEYILDLGCGTGAIAEKIKNFGTNVTGVDRSINMVNQARDKFPDIEFQVIDAIELNYINQFDAVFSNATLHWIKTPESVLNNIYKSLKKEGRFVAEFGGKGNVELITKEIKKQAIKLGVSYHEEQFPWFFPSIGEYTTLMEEAGFNVTFAEHFDRPTPLKGTDGLKNWIKMFGKMMFKSIDEKTLNRLIINVENNLRETMFKEGTWIADYKRIRVIGIKE